MLIAAVCAQGTSEIHNVRDIDRGYERIDERLRGRSARSIERVRGVIHPIPCGTRDVLPDELRELRVITDGIRGVFEARGYGEVATPALEYEEVLTRGDPAAADPAYRLFDEHGNVLVLRSDMTIPIARVVGHALPDAPNAAALLLPPARLPGGAASTAASRARSCRPGSSSSARPAPEGTAEAVSVLCAALDAAGLRAYRVGLGDASLFPRAARRAGVPADARARILHELATRDFVGPGARARAAARRAAGAARRCPHARRRRGARRACPEADDAARALRAGWRDDVARARDLRPRPGAHARLLHGRRLRGLRRRVRLAAGRRRALRRPARALRPRAARLRLGAGRRARARARAGRSAR